jgi:glycosyltransferase involved in cell wall biosynthesis
VFVTVLAVIPLLIWIYLLSFRGGFWRIPRHLAPVEPRQVSGGRVAVVIPARNEADVIGPALTSLLEQDFPTPLHIFLVDDASTDRTAEVAKLTAGRAGRNCLTIITGQPPIAGWTGKLWALSQGITQAQTLAPEYLLLTDADVVHGRDSVAKLVAAANTNGYDLSSYMVKLTCENFCGESANSRLRLLFPETLSADMDCFTKCSDRRSRGRLYSHPFQDSPQNRWLSGHQERDHRRLCACSGSEAHWRTGLDGTYSGN